MPGKRSRKATQLATEEKEMSPASKKLKIGPNTSAKTRSQKSTEGFDDTIDYLEEDTKRVDKEGEGVENQIKEVDKKIKEVKQRIKKAEEEIKKAEEEIKKVNQKIEEAEEGTKEVKEDLKEVKEKIKEVERKIKQMEEKVTQCENIAIPKSTGKASSHESFGYLSLLGLDKLVEERRQLTDEKQKLLELLLEKQSLWKEKQSLMKEKQSLREQKKELESEEKKLEGKKKDLMTEVKKLRNAAQVPRLTKFSSSPCRSNLPEPPGTQSFLGKCWVEARCKTIMEQLELTGRVHPMCLARHSRGGKTRALFEVAQKLFDQGVPTIFISFNDKTGYDEPEAQQVSPLQSLMVRIAWACTKQRPVEKLCDFRGLQCRVDETTLRAWLARIPRCVLLIDELNVLIDARVLEKKEKERTPEETARFKQFAEVAKFLTETFCDKKGRYLVFTSHIGSIGTTLMSYLPSFSACGVKQESLPNMRCMESTDDEREDYLMEFGFSLSTYCSYSPGLLITYCDYTSEIDTLKAKMETLFSKADSKLWTKEFLGCLFSGGPRGITKSWDQFTSIEVLEDGVIQKPGEALEMPRQAAYKGAVSAKNKDVAQARAQQKKKLEFAAWSPLMLETAMKCMGQHENPVFSMVQRLLEGIPKSKERSGNAWELLCLTVVALRCLNRLYGNDNEIEDGILPTLPEDFDFSIEKPVRVTTAKELLPLYTKNLKKSRRPVVKLIIPQDNYFQTFDAFLVFWDGSCCYQWGYQMKHHMPDTMPKATVVDAAILLCGNPKPNQRTNLYQPPKGKKRQDVPWGVLSSATLNQFFGLSLQMATPAEWDTSCKNMGSEGKGKEFSHPR